MTRRTDSASILAVSIAITLYQIDAVTSITLGRTSCDSKIYEIAHDESKSIKWEGEDIPAYCRLGFEAPDTSSSTCINIEKFRTYNCGFFVEVYADSSTKLPSKSYGCESTDLDDEYCIKGRKIIYLKFVYNSSATISFSPNVIITVDVKMDEDISSEGDATGEVISTIIGVLIIGIVIVGFCAHNRECFRQILDTISGCLCGLLELVSGCLCGVWKLVSDFFCCLKDGGRSCVTSVTNECRTFCSQTQSREIEVSVVATPATIPPTTSNTLDFDDATTLELSHHSAPSSGNRYAPPAYVAPTPDATYLDMPPPSYYDVITGNVNVSDV